MVALSKNSKNKLNKIYRKLDLGGGLSQDQMVRQKLQEQEKVSSGAMVGGQATANTVGTAIPIAGAFKAVGEGAATAFRQDDEYGVAATDEGAAVGGVFNPLKQTTTGISAIGKGDAKTAFLNLAAPPLAAYLDNKEARKTRDNAIRDFQNKQSIELATERGKMTKSNNVYSLTERREGGKLSKISNNTILATGATHEEGGIKLPQLGAEVEDKETLKMTKDGGTYVMSDTLINPTSGNTFAKDDLKLSKMKGRLEKINHSFGKNALTLLKNKEQKLVDLHEQVRQEQGLETADGTQVARNGGLLKYSGLNPQPSKIEPISGNPYDNSEFNFPTGQSDKFVSNFQPDYTLDGAINNFQNRTSKGYEIKPTPYRSVVDFQKAKGLKADGKWGKNTDEAYYKTFGNKPSKGLTTLNPDYGNSLSKVEGKFMDNPDVEGIDGVAPTKGKSKFNVSNLSKLSAYTDNITGAIYNYQRSKEKLPNLKTLTYLNPKHVNYSQAIKDTRDTTTAFNRGVDTTNVNQGNANIMKAFALGEQQKGIARISQEESNVNVGIDNDFAGRNKAIEEKNNMTIFNNAERNRLGRDEIRRESQQNIVDANMKFQTQYNIDSKNKNQEADDKDAELAFDKRSNDFIESKKAEREANESGIWKNGRFVRSVRSGRNGGKLSKLKISY